MKLASGRSSTFYFNMKPTMLHPEGAYLIGSLVLDTVADSPADFVGGLEMGAVPIATSGLHGQPCARIPLPAFFVRKQAKEHGTQSLIEGLPRGEDASREAGRAGRGHADDRRLGAEGGAGAVRDVGGVIVSVVTVVDRLEGAADAFKAAGLPFARILTLDDFR